MTSFLNWFRRTILRKGDRTDNVVIGSHLDLPTAKVHKSDLECKILNLDGEELTFYVKKNALGMKLYENVFQTLEFSQEQDYFGLQYVDKVGGNRWLDVTKPVRAQCPGKPPYNFKLQVKFYSSDPHSLHDEMTRYYFVLQLRADIREGRLPCDPELGADLAALLLQGEFGDFNEEEQTLESITSISFLPEEQQTEDFDEHVVEKYKQLSGMNLTPAMTDKKYLEKVHALPDYGVDMHQVQGIDGKAYSLGLTPSGILIYEGHDKLGLFIWKFITKLEFKRSQLKVVVTEEDDQQDVKIHKFVFTCEHAQSCKHLWKCAVEHHSFFRLSNATNPQKKPSVGLFRLRSRFQSSFRTEIQIHRSNTFGSSARRSSSFQRTPSVRFSSRRSTSNAETRRELRDKIREEHKAAILNKIEALSEGSYNSGDHVATVNVHCEPVSVHVKESPPAHLCPISRPDTAGVNNADQMLTKPPRGPAPKPPTIQDEEALQRQMMHTPQRKPKVPPPRPPEMPPPRSPLRPEVENDRSNFKKPHDGLYRLPTLPSARYASRSSPAPPEGIRRVPVTRGSQEMLDNHQNNPIYNGTHSDKINNGNSSGDSEGEIML